MDYKKAYMDALERAQKGLPMDEVFPELKESEDERIRKAISYAICTAAHQDGTLINCVTKEEAIAYLKNQKEQKPLSTEETELNSIAFLEQMGYTCIPPQKEQQPADYDHEMRKNCEVNFEGGKKEVINNPEKYGLCKPAEWSEEDNINLNACMQIINDAWEIAQIKELGTTKFAPHYYGDLIDWLKSLRHSWKPSEEQMEALKDAFRKDGGNEYRKVINSLYCDLQKLL